MILVGICSCRQHPERRQACRSTWVPDLSPGVDYRFFVGGGPDAVPEADTVVLPVDDGYRSLPAKVLAFMRWAMDNSDFEWLFKCDDDTYVRGDRLLETAREAEGRYAVVGSPNLDWPGRYPSGGAGYLLPRAVVEKIVGLGLPDTGAEDVLIGQAALRFGAPWPHPGFSPRPGPAPHPDNAAVTCHALEPDRMRAVHGAWRAAARDGPALVVLGHGRRECLERAVASAVRRLRRWYRLVIVDDSGDAGYRSWIADALAPDALVPVGPGRRGYREAMTAVWTEGRRHPAGIFLLEEDFEIVEPMDVGDLRRIQELSGAVQVSLMRQPWYANEVAAGGVVQSLGADVFRDREQEGLRWMEHRAFYTTNPSFVPASTFRRWDWPGGMASEASMGLQVFADPGTVAAYLGHRNDPPAVLHGGDRTGFGY